MKLLCVAADNINTDFRAHITLINGKLFKVSINFSFELKQQKKKLDICKPMQSRWRFFFFFALCQRKRERERVTRVNGNKEIKQKL